MRTRVRTGQLAGIERDLRQADPRLAGLLDMFTRLNAAETMPATEQTDPPRSRARLAMTMIALIAGLCLAVAAMVGVHQAAAAQFEMPRSTSGHATPARLPTAR